MYSSGLRMDVVAAVSCSGSPKLKASKQIVILFIYKKPEIIILFQKHNNIANKNQHKK